MVAHLGLLIEVVAKMLLLTVSAGRITRWPPSWHSSAAPCGLRSPRADLRHGMPRAGQSATRGRMGIGPSYSSTSGEIHVRIASGHRLEYALMHAYNSNVR
jgi:hypothetical protein